MELRALSLDEWTEALPDAGIEVFHLPGALSALSRHAPGDLRLYGGFKGDSLVAMAPLFLRTNRLGRTVTSPPPSHAVPRLGPLVMPDSPKRRKRERVHDRFVEGLLDAAGAREPRTLTRLVLPAECDDPRPYRWRGLDVRPSFTYRLDLAGRNVDDLIGSFSRSLRRELRKTDEVDLAVERESAGSIRAVYDLLSERYEEQGRGVPLSWEFFRDVVRRLDDRARVYTVRDRVGRLKNGMVVLYAPDTAYYWLGGVAGTHDGVSTNSLVQWRIIRDLLEDPALSGVETYDLVGANTRRIAEYKSSFGGRLVTYYVVESEGVAMKAAKRAYELLG